MTYVHILRGITFPSEWYTGHTNDLKARLRDHNSGRSVHTAQCKPWGLVTYLAFNDETRASQFEQYLKSGSGRAFARKHLR